MPDPPSKDLGSVAGALPFGRVLALEVANSFSALAGGSPATFATRVRFFQQQGYDSSVAVSSGVVVSTASWFVKGALFLISLPLAGAPSTCTLNLRGVTPGWCGSSWWPSWSSPW